MILPNESEYDFIRRIWSFITEKEFYESRKYYTRIFDRVREEIETIRRNTDMYALRAPEDIFDVVQRLAELKDVTKDNAFKAIREKPPSVPYTEDHVLKTLRCAINLWLTVGLGPEIRHTGKPFRWDDSDTLRQTISSHFEVNVRGTDLSTRVELQLQEDTTAVSLRDYYGFEILWTHNLSQHLSINWPHRTVTIYMDKIVAHNHIRGGTSSLPVPDQLFEETIDTLNLLFPFQHKPTKKMLESYDVHFYGLGTCGRPRKLLLGDYHYWRRQIANIHQIFQGPPIGIQQVLPGDKGENFNSAFTFWVAVGAGVVAVFGLALAIASLAYSVKQFELGLKQYELSIVQACGDTFVLARMPQLCSDQK